MTYGEKLTAITGIGLSEVTRGATKSALALTLDACLGAIADAGLRPEEVDGVSSFPGIVDDTSGLSPISIAVLQDALRLRLGWYSAGGEGSGQLVALFNAIGAIAAGLARHVLVFRTIMEATARRHASQGLFPRDRPARGQLAEWAPFGVVVPATVHALYFQRYVQAYGVRAEQVGQFVVNCRRNAARNPDAVYRAPLTMDEYLASPMLSTPLRLHDCDVPVDASVAFVVSRRDAARDRANPPLSIEAVGSAVHGRNSWSQRQMFDDDAIVSAARMLWARTDLTMGDVQLAQVYDGFSYHALLSLEALGVCGRGEAAAFVSDPARIAIEGELPLNTGGGQLSAGRLHGFGHLHESCVQLWRRAGARQVPGEPRVALSCTAGGPRGGAVLLVRP